MQTHIIRRLISEAIAHEKKTGTLAQLLYQQARNNGQSLNRAQISQAVASIQQYVEHTPLLMDATAAAAQQVGQFEAILPILDSAQQYFVAPNDLIPDQMGLVGIMDDAYLANSLMQMVSAYHQQTTGFPLLPVDMAMANQLVRGLIGEPLASQLDGIVSQTLGIPTVQQATQSLQGYQGSLPVEEGSWGPYVEDEIARLSAKLGFSF